MTPCCFIHQGHQGLIPNGDIYNSDLATTQKQEKILTIGMYPSNNPPPFQYFTLPHTFRADPSRMVGIRPNSDLILSEKIKKIQTQIFSHSKFFRVIPSGIRVEKRCIFRSFPTIFWPYSDPIPTPFRPHSYPIPTIFRPHSDHILTKFRPNSDLIPTKIWPNSCVWCQFLFV